MVIERDDGAEEFRILDPQTGTEGEWFDYGQLGWLKVGERLYVSEPTGIGELAEDMVYEVHEVGTSVRRAETLDEDEDEGEEDEGEEAETGGTHPAD